MTTEPHSLVTEVAETCTVANNVVQMSVEAMRAVIGYVPLQVGLDGDFDPASFPTALRVIDASELGELFTAEGLHPSAHLAVMREEGIETVNLFASTPNAASLVAAHRVEAEVVIERARILGRATASFFEAGLWSDLDRPEAA